MRVEQFDQLGEIGKGAGQPIDLVDDDDVDSVSAHVIEEPRLRPFGCEPKRVGLHDFVITPPDRSANLCLDLCHEPCGD